MPTPSTTSPITAITGSSGNALIDAMLATREVMSVSQAQRAQIVGHTAYKWGGDIGTGANLSYSFAGPGAIFDPSYPTNVADLRPMPDNVKAAFTLALQAWATVANVTFQEVPDTPSLVGDIRIGVSASNPYLGPGRSDAEAVPPASPAPIMSGDVWIAPNAAAGPQSWDWNVIGGRGYFFTMHELGHAIFNRTDASTDAGLNGAKLPASLNYFGQTIMSYSAAPGSTVGDAPRGGGLSSYPTTPMVLDVLAAQWLYGPNTAYHAGDDAYSYSQGTTVYQTIWDGGGNDTISIAGNTKAGIIDLRPGEYSDVGSVVTAFTASGNVSFSRTVGIAYGATIEGAIGGSGNDSIVGNDANNSLRGNGGNDTIDGGRGIDTALFAGTRAQYGITPVGATIAVSDNASSRDGTDTLTAVERLRFSDAVLAFDTDGNAGQAYRLYQAAFDRTPDKAGLTYWVNNLDHGMSLSNAAASFIASAEFKAAYGDPVAMPSSVFLDTLYANILGRAPDLGGKAYWQGELNRGIAREKVLASFSESTENKAIVGIVIANGIELDPTGLT